MMVGQTKLPIGRDDIDVPRFNRRQAGDLGHRHFCARGKNGGELTLALRVEMEDNNESRIDVVGKSLEKHLQSVHAPADVPMPTVGKRFPLPSRLRPSSPEGRTP